MKKVLALLFILLFVLIMCVGCVSLVTLPYGSEEYANGDWTIEKLEAHFKELGFVDIKVTETRSFDAEKSKINRVAIEDPDADSWFTEYRDFEKGEQVDTYKEVFISATTKIPTLTVDNCDELAKLIQKDSDDRGVATSSFMNEHSGEYIEFDGTISQWEDEWWWINVSLSVLLENSNEFHFSWRDISISDLKTKGEYHYEQYSQGMLKEGMQVHMIAKIVYKDDSWSLEIESTDIIS